MSDDVISTDQFPITPHYTALPWCVAGALMGITVRSKADQTNHQGFILIDIYLSYINNPRDNPDKDSHGDR
jgi:hypothetical protein